MDEVPLPREIRPDSHLRGIDVAASITRGLMLEGAARRALYTEVAIAAALQAEDLGTRAYPLAFLARYVRTAGLEQAIELPQPLIRAEQTDLVREWMAAAQAAGTGLAGDDVFARWLDMVAALLAVRRAAQTKGR